MESPCSFKESAEYCVARPIQRRQLLQSNHELRSRLSSIICGRNQEVWLAELEIVRLRLHGLLAIVDSLGAGTITINNITTHDPALPINLMYSRPFIPQIRVIGLTRAKGQEVIHRPRRLFAKQLKIQSASILAINLDVEVALWDKYENQINIV